METLYYSIYRSPVGPLTIVVSGQGLLRLELPPANGNNGVPHRRRGADEGARGSSLSRTVSRPPSLILSEERTRPYVRELEAYFAGERREFSFPLDLRGTDFQKRCWQALLKIPYGQTRTYADQARAIGSPRAFRAVGMANHDNPIAIVVPCHRVIASDGTLGGYGGGLPLKRKLLQLEGSVIPSAARNDGQPTPP